MIIECCRRVLPYAQGSDTVQLRQAVAIERVIETLVSRMRTAHPDEPEVDDAGRPLMGHTPTPVAGASLCRQVKKEKARVANRESKPTRTFFTRPNPAERKGLFGDTDALGTAVATLYPYKSTTRERQRNNLPCRVAVVSMMTRTSSRTQWNAPTLAHDVSAVAGKSQIRPPYVMGVTFYAPSGLGATSTAPNLPRTTPDHVRRGPGRSARGVQISTLFVRRRNLSSFKPSECTNPTATRARPFTPGLLTPISAITGPSPTPGDTRQYPCRPTERNTTPMPKDDPAPRGAR